jgi:hypothetical protein
MFQRKQETKIKNVFSFSTAAIVILAHRLAAGSKKKCSPIAERVTKEVSAKKYHATQVSNYANIGPPSWSEQVGQCRKTSVM